jgi:hypothetical protein
MDLAAFVWDLGLVSFLYVDVWILGLVIGIKYIFRKVGFSTQQRKERNL